MRREQATQHALALVEAKRVAPLVVEAAVVHDEAKDSAAELRSARQQVRMLYLKYSTSFSTYGHRQFMSPPFQIQKLQQQLTERSASSSEDGELRMLHLRCDSQSQEVLFVILLSGVISLCFAVTD